MKHLFLLFIADGLLASCSGRDPLPAPVAELPGHWAYGDVLSVYTNAAGAVTNSSTTTPAQPTRYLDITPTTWKEFLPGQEALYTRDGNTVTTLLVLSNAQPVSTTYRIATLSEHRLVLQWELPLADGGRFVRTTTYSR